MTEFIDILYCENENRKIVAVAPMSACIRSGDIVLTNESNKFYIVLRQVNVVKDSDIYKLIVEDLYGNLYKVTDKYSHQKIGGTENE